MERGYALSLEFVNGTGSTIYVEEGSDAHGVSKETKIPPYNSATIVINNIGEVLYYTPSAYLKYIDPNTNQEVKIYLKDI